MTEKPIGVSDYRNIGGAFVPFQGQSSPCGGGKNEFDMSVGSFHFIF